MRNGPFPFWPNVRVMSVFSVDVRFRSSQPRIKKTPEAAHKPVLGPLRRLAS